MKLDFLNGLLEDEVNVKQPPGFEVKGQEGNVYKVRKTLYGLKKIPRAWNKRIVILLIKLGFKKFTLEHGMYVKGKNEQHQIILCLHVDGMLVTSSNEIKLTRFKSSMEIEFEISDLENLTYFLGMEVVNAKFGVFLHQKKYIKDILKKFMISKLQPCN